MSDWLELPEGIFAIHDPDDPASMKYWRRKDTKRGMHVYHSFRRWPAGTIGSLLTARDGKDPYVRIGGYLARVIEAIAEDPVAAGRRFAQFCDCCCRCGKVLTDPVSKSYGIGPDCRRDISPELLARYLTPQVERLHAQTLLEEIA